MMLQKKDVPAVAVLMLATAMYARGVVDFSVPPIEDAAMLMRYAAHFAQGQGIVWNTGSPPVDGATDFLFMIAAGLLNAAGLPLEGAVRWLTVGSHFLTIALIYCGCRHIYNAAVIPAGLGALYFAVGPGLFLAAAYFGTPFFVLFVCAAWIAALRIIFVSRSTASIAAFALLSLLSGLARPEGVLVSVFMLTAVVLALGPAPARRLLAVFTVTFLILGGAYFLWRWSYFGHPLPNPFYRKGGGTLHYHSLRRSLWNTLKLCYPFMPVFILGFRSKQLRRILLAFAVPVLGSACMWVLLSDDMNFGSRFQYPILPIVLLSWLPFAKNLRQDLRLPKLSDLGPHTRLSVLAAGALLVAGIMQTQVSISKRIVSKPDGRYDVALMLSRYAQKNYTIATTEAGLLPLYSGWRAVDTWGLNNIWITRNGGITRQYIDSFKPEIIMWHAYFPPLAPPDPSTPDSAWFRMVMQLKSYAEQNNYILAAAFGESPYDTHYYYCSPDLPERDEIVAQIRNTDYRWFESGTKCFNYALIDNNLNGCAKPGTL